MFKIYKNNVIEALQMLSDYQFQKLAWFLNDRGVVASYNENVMWVFDDTALGDALDEGEVIFGANADNALRDLESETDKIEGDDYLEEEIIDMPQMQVIREKAARALELVLQSDGSESTVEIVE